MADKGAKDFSKEVSKEAPKGGECLGMTAIKPKGWDITGKEAFMRMLYNKDTGEVLTRTPLSWLKIITFYLIYYSLLAGFWIACLFIFFCTLPEVEHGPRWKTDWSLIGMNPGVGLRPRSNDRNIDSNMFLLKANTTNEYPQERHGEGDLNADYAIRLQEYLNSTYNNHTMGSTLHGKQYTVFNAERELDECSTFPYGYVGERVSPCILLKLNTIWGWTPKPINCSWPREKCPDTLKAHLASSNGIQNAGVDNIWFDCNGRQAADKEALAGNGLQYFPPTRSIPINAFPYEGTSRGVYHSPLVALKVTPGKNHIGQLIHIECRAYYRGVDHSTKYKTGLVQFEVLVKE